MNSRERTFIALDHQEPDRVPIDFWCSNSVSRKLEAVKGKPIEEIMDDWDVDLRYAAGPAYVGPELRSWPEDSSEDLWGVRRLCVETEAESYNEVTEFPLANARSVEEIEEYSHWPSPDDYDYSVVEKQLDDIRERGRVSCFMGDRLNRVAQLKPAMYLRGVEQIFIDLATQPDIALCVIRKIREFYVEYERRVLEAANGKLDIMVTGDDFGMQHAPLLSPQMWEEFLGEGFAQYNAVAHEYGVKVMHHTCGDVWPLIPRMIDGGLDILQSIQPEAAEMDAARLKAEFGDKLCFHGGMSIQRTMPFGTAEDVETEVRKRISSLAAGGGYILCTAHNIQGDSPIEKIDVLMDAYHKHGRYDV